MNPKPARELFDDLKATGPNPEASPNTDEAKTGGQRCRIHAIRHQITGQFYALSVEDRIAFDKHCHGILEDLKPANHRERWLAASIAEDQWRLNRARALENNIFAIGMSGPISDATDGDSTEVQAAACQARVWLTDGKNLQGLSLYEQRIRRTIEKNEKQLYAMQSERNTVRNQALEEAVLLAGFALSHGDTSYDPTEDLGENGFGFSISEILRLARRKTRLRQALQYQKQMTRDIPKGGPVPMQKAA